MTTRAIRSTYKTSNTTRISARGLTTLSSIWRSARLLFDSRVSEFLCVKKRPGRGESRPGLVRRQCCSLHRDDVRSLRALFPIDDVELDLLAFLQGAEPVLLDGAVVNEHVLATLHGDEAVALLRVEPLDRASNHCGLAPFVLCTGLRTLVPYLPRRAYHLAGPDVNIAGDGRGNSWNERPPRGVSIAEQ